MWTLTCLAQNANVRVAANRRPEREYFPWVKLKKIKKEIIRFEIIIIEKLY